MIQPDRTFSPFAPPGLAGLPQLPNDGSYLDEPHTYTFLYGPLAQGATVTGLYQIIDSDADFYWRCTAASSYFNLQFGVRFQDPFGQYLSDDFIGGLQISSQYLLSPLPWVASVFCPAGTKIMIDLQNTANSDTAVQLLFVGVKRFKLG